MGYSPQDQKELDTTERLNPPPPNNKRGPIVDALLVVYLTLLQPPWTITCQAPLSVEISRISRITTKTHNHPTPKESPQDTPLWSDLSPTSSPWKLLIYFLSLQFCPF